MNNKKYKSEERKGEKETGEEKEKGVGDVRIIDDPSTLPQFQGATSVFYLAVLQHRISYHRQIKSSVCTTQHT